LDESLFLHKSNNSKDVIESDYEDLLDIKSSTSSSNESEIEGEVEEEEEERRSNYSSLSADSPTTKRRFKKKNKKIKKDESSEDDDDDNDDSDDNENNKNELLLKNGRFSQKDLYNLYDHASICQALKSNQTKPEENDINNDNNNNKNKSYHYLFKMKNFLRQFRAIFSLMYFWSIDDCLEMVEFLLNKCDLFERYHNTLNNSSSYQYLITILNEKKLELTAYKELTICARRIFDKYNEHQQLRDELDIPPVEEDENNKNDQNEKSTIRSKETENLLKMKKICQQCLRWQYAKNQLETTTTPTPTPTPTTTTTTTKVKKSTAIVEPTDLEMSNEEINELIMDLFLLNDKFMSAKYLIRKLGLDVKLQFKLDYGHLKYRLLNLNVSSSIIVIDLETILNECIAFNSQNSTKNEQNSDYIFEICYRLLNELKDSNELNNQVVISLCEYLIINYKDRLLSDIQVNQLKTLQLTARIFQLLIEEKITPFDSYKRHHSSPLLIIEQLLMNSHIEVCSRCINMCRETHFLTDSTFHQNINSLLLHYARKALEFKVHIQTKVDKTTTTTTTTTPPINDNTSVSSHRSSVVSNSNFNNRRKSAHQLNYRQSPMTIEKRISIVSETISISSTTSSKVIDIPFNITDSTSDSNHLQIPESSFTNKLSPSPFSSPNGLSSSFKNFYKFSHSPNGSQVILSSSSFSSLGRNSITPNNNDQIKSSTGRGINFIMPLVAPSKELWVKDELVNSCMVCDTRRFGLINRRHHCRRCGRVVCSNCSKRVTLIDSIPRRTCDDCFTQIEKANNLSTNQSNIPSGVVQMRRGKSETNASTTDSIDDKKIYWQLTGNSKTTTTTTTTTTDETTIKDDNQIRKSFRYQQSPSTSLCLSILDMHAQALQCGKDLLNMCDELSNYLQTEYYQSEDLALIISMIKHLVHNAKMKLVQNSSNILSLCDSYLSLIDVLEKFLLANCSKIPSLSDLRNVEISRRICSRLLEEERYELAMNLCTKCGLDTQIVWCSWGLIELRLGNYKEARTKFEKCFKVITDKNGLIGPSQLKYLNDIISYLEAAPPLKLNGPQSMLASLRSVESLIAEPSLYPINSTNMDTFQITECLFYIQMYGNHSMMVQFYQRNDYLDKSIQYLIDNRCSTSVFQECLLIPSLKNGEFYTLLDCMSKFDKLHLGIYYGSIGGYLKNINLNNTLYDFQLFMKVNL
jgi:hypothetical protein